MLSIPGTSTRPRALELDNSDRPDIMSTRLPRVPVALALSGAVLIACAPGVEWVHPTLPLVAREADLRDCRIEADLAVDRESRLARRHYEPDGSWSASPADRAMAEARLHQFDLVAGMHRERLFEACMHGRGYTARRIGP
jgi:hypothetical protein